MFYGLHIKIINLQGIYPKMASLVEGFGLFKQALKPS